MIKDLAKTVFLQQNFPIVKRLLAIQSERVEKHLKIPDLDKNYFFWLNLAQNDLNSFPIMTRILFINSGLVKKPS